MIRTTIRRLAARLLTAAVLSSPLAMPAPTFANELAAPATPALSSRQLYERAINSTCWIVLPEKMGTGWVLDVEKRLVITNEHVIRDSDSAEVFFPIKVSGKLVRDPKHYRQNVKPAKATVIDRDSVRDLAVLQLDSLPVHVKQAKIAADSPESGEMLRAVGALPQGSEGLWGHISGEVRGVVKRPTGSGHVIMMVETAMPINRGNSGGGVFNEAGELAGVVQSAWFGGQVVGTSMLIDVTEVRAFLNESLPLLDPKTSAEFMARGERRLREGRFDGAIDDFTAAVVKDNKLVSAYLRRGVAKVRKGDAPAGVADFDAALLLEPQSRDALFQRGIARRNIGNLDGAIADFTRIIDGNENATDALHQRGIAQSIAKRPEAALEDLNRAIALNPRNAICFADRAIVHRNLRKLDNAIADWKKAAELAPSNAQFTNELGILLLNKGDANAAAAAFVRAANLERNNPIFHSNLGVAQIKAGKLTDAVQSFDEALRLAPDGTRNFNAAIAWSERGAAHRALKDHAAAIRDLSKAIALNSKVAVYWYERGLAHQAAGSTSAATSDFNEAVKLDARTFGPKIAAMNPIVGRWSYQGLINGVRVEITCQFDDSGKCSDVTKIDSNFGVQQTENRGTYTVHGEVLAIESPTTGKLNRKVKFEGRDKVVVEFTEIGMNLVFDRVK